MATCVPKPIRIVVSCDAKFYRSIPMKTSGELKMWRFALQRQWSQKRCKVYALDQYRTLIIGNRIRQIHWHPICGRLYGYRKCPKSHSEPAEVAFKGSHVALSRLLSSFFFFLQWCILAVTGGIIVDCRGTPVGWILYYHITTLNWRQVDNRQPLCCESGYHTPINSVDHYQS